MLERFLSLIERIAVALETIAGAPAVCALARAQSNAAPILDITPVVNRGAEQQALTAGAQDFMPVALAPPSREVVGGTPSKPQQTDDKPTLAPPTREAVGGALIDLATISRDKAVEVIASFNGAKKLSDIAESDYPALFAAIGAAIASLKKA